MPGWRRLDDAWLLDPRLRLMPGDSRLLWPVLLSLAGQVGRRGLIPAQYLAPAYLADVTGRSVTSVSADLAAFVASGLVVVDADGWQIERWQQYQPDPNVAERVRLWRNRQTDVTPVTVTGVSNGCNDDVTGRDVTGRDVTEVDPGITGASGESTHQGSSGVQGVPRKRGGARKVADGLPADWPGWPLVDLWLREHPFWRQQDDRERAAARPRIAEGIDGLLRLDRRSPDQVRQVLRWIIDDEPRRGWPGWAAVMKSPGKLRERSKSDRTVTYWQIVCDQMHEQGRDVERPQATAPATEPQGLLAPPSRTLTPEEREAWRRRITDPLPSAARGGGHE